jgi:uncharacterized membrane protein YvlD (DUF360 family)
LLTARITDALMVEGFVPAFLGALVVSIVSMFFNAVLNDEKD